MRSWPSSQASTKREGSRSATSSCALWLMGRPDAGLEQARRATALARQIAHPFSDAYAQTFLTVIHQLRGDLDAALDQAQTRITNFEAQVAALLAEQEQALGDIAALETERAQLLTEQEALNLALAQSRDEIDAQTEAARLAAARREALEAMIADLKTKGEQPPGNGLCPFPELDPGKRSPLLPPIEIRIENLRCSVSLFRAGM